jgi:outer membrane protein assembly factor BamB
MRSGASHGCAIALVCACLVPVRAQAVGTRTFELDSLEKLSGGELQGVSVGSDGVVRAGWTLSNLAFPPDAGTTVTCALAMPDGAVLLGTGPASGGKVVRVANDRATVIADTKESAVSALAVDRAGVVYAATTGNKIYRVAAGRVDVLATLPDVDSILALTFDQGGQALFAGTGSDGRVVRITTGGVSSVYFNTSAPFVVSLAVGEDGAVYAGTSGGKGLIYRITAPGRGAVLYDFPAGDVRALATGPNRTLYAVVNEESGNASEAQEAAAARRTSGGRSAPGPTSGPRSKPGKGSLWRFDAIGRPEHMMHHDEFHYESLTVDAHGRPYVGTGAEGRVYTVDDTHAVALMADTTERQIGALGVGARSGFVMGSDPAVFHRILSIGGPEAVWTSKPLDAGLRARFGHLTWRGTGPLEVSTRTGDTQTPDATWSPWSPPVGQGGTTPSPSGRFIQVRARLTDATATLADVVVPFVTENLRAVVTEVAAKSTTSPHESKETLPQSGSEMPKHDSVVHLAWKVENPDNDELRYRVQFQHEGQARWVDATRPDDVLTKPELEWDTAALPEGKYRLRVDASDEMANPPDAVTHNALVSAPVIVDNTPPIFKTVAMQGRRLRAEVVDGVGPIARIEIAVDGHLEWHPLAPADGILDSADETIDVDLTPLLGPTGPHIVAIRVFDAAGNAVVRDVEVP